MSKKTTLFAVVLVALASAVLVIALLWRGAGAVTPPVILPTPQTGAEQSGAPQPGVVLAEVTPETVQAAIATLSRAQAYARTVTIEYFWQQGEGSGSTEIREWRNSGSTRIRIESADDAENILLSGDKTYIWYDKAIGLYEADTEGGAAEADRWLRCLTYEEVLSLPQGDITDAGYSVYAGETCIWASYVSDTFNYENIVYVSVNTGLLMGAETYDGEELIYRMTSGAPDPAAPDASWFRLPEGSE